MPAAAGSTAVLAAQGAAFHQVEHATTATKSIGRCGRRLPNAIAHVLKGALPGTRHGRHQLQRRLPAAAAAPATTATTTLSGVVSVLEQVLEQVPALARTQALAVAVVQGRARATARDSTAVGGRGCRSRTWSPPKSLRRTVAEYAS